jgi:hypothetical protein
VCALRLRSLLKTTVCPWCKSTHPHIYIGRDEKALYRVTGWEEKELGMYFEEERCRSQVLANRDAVCVLCKADNKAHMGKQIFQSKAELQHHLDTVHKQLMCDFCLKHKPVFPHEHQLYATRQSLLAHQNAPKTGHPVCAVCRTRFYSDDELQVHCRERHEQCHICARHQSPTRTTSNNNNSCYYEDYQALSKHFAEKHYVCTEPVCVEMRFVVFGSELEYKAHQQQVHFGQVKMQRSQQRLAARIEVPFSAGTGGRRSGGSTATSSRSTIGITTTTNATTNNTTTNTSAPNHHTLVQKAPLIDTTWFMFDPESATAHAQTMFSLVHQNKEFAAYLASTNQATRHDQLRQTCRQFQRGRIDASQLIGYLKASGFDVEGVCQRLEELVVDRARQVELRRAREDYVKLQAAFPALPSTGSNSGTNNTNTINGVIRGRIVAPSLAAPAVRRPGTLVDPARDPLALIGSLRLGSSRPPLPGPVPAPKPKPSQFPKLPQAPKPPTNQATPSRPHAKPVMSDADDSDAVFTIGGQHLQQSTTEPESRVKQKKQLLMRFGGFSNPVNNTDDDSKR